MQSVENKAIMSNYRWTWQRSLRFHWNGQGFFASTTKSCSLYLCPQAFWQLKKKCCCGFVLILRIGKFCQIALNLNRITLYMNEFSKCHWEILRFFTAVDIFSRNNEFWGKKFALESSCINIITVFPRINARGIYFKIRDFRGAFIRGGRLFQNVKNRGNRIWTYKNKKTFMPCDQCYLHCDMLTNYSHTYKN